MKAGSLVNFAGKVEIRVSWPGRRHNSGTMNLIRYKFTKLPIGQFKIQGISAKGGIFCP